MRQVHRRGISQCVGVLIEVLDWVLVPGSGSAVLSSGGGGSGGGLGVVGDIQGADRVDVRRG